MKTNMTGMDPDAPEMKQFREEWIKFTGQENQYLSGQEIGISSAQLATIHLWTGASVPVTIENKLDPQAELEAVFRARSRALAAAFQRGAQG